jgi:hypothetical protein
VDTPLPPTEVEARLTAADEFQRVDPLMQLLDRHRDRGIDELLITFGILIGLTPCFTRDGPWVEDRNPLATPHLEIDLRPHGTVKVFDPFSIERVRELFGSGYSWLQIQLPSDR